MKFWDPLHISGTVQARNFKFGIQIDHEVFVGKKIRCSAIAEKPRCRVG